MLNDTSGRAALVVGGGVVAFLTIVGGVRTVLSGDSTFGAADEPCSTCDGAQRTDCTRCDGTGRYCDTCSNEKSVCSACRGHRKIECAQCRGEREESCRHCSGEGKVFVPKRRVFGRSRNGKAGLRRVVKAHFKKCATCKGKGKRGCRACRGAGEQKCGPCKGRGSLVCASCRDRSEKRQLCNACDGRSWVDCPDCTKQKVQARSSTDRPPEVVVEDLNWAVGELDTRPVLTPLLALAHVGSLGNPYAIVVFRKALGSEHSWIRAMALEELLKFDGSKLAEIGGEDLVRALVGLVRSESDDVCTLAEESLRRVSERYPQALSQEGRGSWRFVAAGFPEGRRLPAPAPPGLVDGADGADGGKVRKGRTYVPRSLGSTKAFALHLGAEKLKRRGLDLIWAIDCSGSMRPHFDSTRKTVLNCTRLFRDLLGFVLVGLVPYRNGVESTLPVTDSPERFEGALARLRAAEGGNYPEGVDFALKAAFQRRKMRLRDRAYQAVVVIGDERSNPQRGLALIRKLRELRSDVSRSRLRLHCVAVGQAATTRPHVRAFWKDLAAAGGGGLHAHAEKNLLRDLCTAIPTGVDEKTLRRVVQLVLRVADKRASYDSELQRNGRAGGP